MKVIEKITFEKTSVNWTSTKFNTRMAYIVGGGKIKVESILSYIGNNNLDSWSNVEKIRKSTSNKNIKNYLNQFISRVEII